MMPAEKKAKYFIVYLAYGADANKYQAVLSIYTLCHQVGSSINDFSIVIYTDKAHGVFSKYLKGLPVIIELLSKQQIKQYRGADDYIFRVKPLVMKDYFEKYKQNVFFLDTDTYFLRNPVALLDTIRPGYTIMNAEEYNFVDAGPVEPLHWYNLRQALKRHKYKVNGETISIPITTTMWNSGVMGISYGDARLMNDIISLNDEMYNKSGVFNVEQFAASYILQANTKLVDSGDYIEHYWVKGLKNVYNASIPAFLKANAKIAGQQLYDSAFAFAVSTNKAPHQNNEPLPDRIKKRVELILKVARKGHL